MDRRRRGWRSKRKEKELRSTIECNSSSTLALTSLAITRRTMIVENRRISSTATMRGQRTSRIAKMTTSTINSRRRRTRRSTTRRIARAESQDGHSSIGRQRTGSTTSRKARREAAPCTIQDGTATTMTTRTIALSTPTEDSPEPRAQN